MGDRKTVNQMREEIRAFKRLRIVEAAQQLFFERGYEATSVELLANELGVTKPFIYSYFENKRAILEAVHYQAAQRILTNIDLVTTTYDSPELALREFIRLFASDNIRNQVASGVFLQEEKHLSPEALNAIKILERSVNKKLAQLIQAGIDQGVFRVGDASMASMAISGIVRWVHRWYHRDGRLSPEAIADHLAELGLNLVCFEKKPVAQSSP
jgi:AcrR family transcriptional regulator